MEPRAVRTEVVGGEGARRRDAVTEQAPRQHSVCRDPDPELARGRQDVGFDAPGYERVFDLEIGDRMHGCRATERLAAHLRQPDVPHVPGLHHLGDGAHRVLDRHRGIKPGRAVDVDVVDPEARQCVGEEVLHRLRSSVEATPPVVGGAKCAELHAELHVVAATVSQCPADQHLVVPHAVEVARVDEVDAGVDGGMDGGDRLGVIAGAVDAGHAHRTEADARDRGTSFSKGYLLNVHAFTFGRLPTRRQRPVIGGPPIPGSGGARTAQWWM